MCDNDHKTEETIVSCPDWTYWRRPSSNSWQSSARTTEWIRRRKNHRYSGIFPRHAFL